MCSIIGTGVQIIPILGIGRYCPVSGDWIGPILLLDVSVNAHTITIQHWVLGGLLGIVLTFIGTLAICGWFVMLCAAGMIDLYPSSLIPMPTVPVISVRYYTIYYCSRCYNYTGKFS